MKLTSDDLAVLSQIKKHTAPVSAYHMAKFIYHMTAEQVTKSCEYLVSCGELTRVEKARGVTYKKNTNRFFVSTYIKTNSPCSRKDLMKAALSEKLTRERVVYVIHTMKKSGKLIEVDGILTYIAESIPVKILFEQLLSGVRK